MATQMTPEEIQAIFDEYNQALANGIPVTKEMNDRLRDASKGIKDYSATLRSSLGALGQASKQLGKDLMDGKKGAQVFNDSLEKAADAASNVAVGFGPLGIAVGLVIKAFSFFVTQVNKQSDKLYESFQNISRSGAIGAQGMDQVFESMMKMGYTIDELGNMGEVLRESSKNFGLFSSSVLSGTKQFADVANTIQNSDLRAKFFNMGLSVDDINKGIAGYMNQQGRLGKLQDQTQAEVRKGAVAYIKEMETLTRLTGQQREELEAQREQAMAVDAFYAAIEDMPADAREQALATYNALAKQNPELAKEMAANFAGIMTGQTDMFLATGGKSMEIFSRDFYMNGGKMENAMNNLGGALAENRDTLKGVAQVGGKFGVSLRDADQLIRKDFVKGMGEAAASVEDSANGTNAATDAQSKLRDSQIKQGQAMQDLINIGVNPVTKAMKILASAIDALIDLIPFSGSARAKAAAEAKAGGGGAGPSGAGGSAKSVVGGSNNANLSGLRIKSEEATAGGEINPGLADLAQNIQSQLGDRLRYFSAFNDRYHQGLDRNSAHKTGTALDFTLTDPSEAAAVSAMVGSMPGVKSVLNEYARLSSGGTGGHIHAEINGAAGFRGSLSGPMSGYSPNLLMHGNEEFSIRPSGGSSNDSAGASEGSLTRLADKTDDMIQLMRAQLAVNEKILKYQQ